MDRQIPTPAPKAQKASAKGVPKPLATTAKWPAENWAIQTHSSSAAVFLILTSSAPSSLVFLPI